MRMKADVSGSDILRDLDYLAQFSATNGQHGVTRLPWTSFDRDVVAVLQSRCEDLGMRVHLDAVNNLWAVWDVGASSSIVMGSHRDSVPRGGRFDGIFGVVGALETVQQLKAHHYRPRHNIEIVAWNDEEGARFGTTLFGSRIYTGAIQAVQWADKRDRDNISLAEAASMAGYPLEQMFSNDLSRIAAYLEMHIEQGPWLDRNQCSIGVVSGVNVQFRERITLHGIRVHAAYSASDRSDPVFATASVWHHLHTLIGDANRGYLIPRVVATIGQIDVHSHLINAVPPEIVWSVDVRSSDANLAQDILEMLHRDLKFIGQQKGFACDIQPLDTHADLAGISDASRPIEFDQTLQAIITEATNQRGYSFQVLPSWAGHDAMALAPRVPTAMIFVPSVDGLSHTPEEWTHPDDLAKGIDVLLNTMLMVDGGF
ncbi:Zn-dependent hydrolase [Sulfobacillus thermosulfidooxidans]|uniref:Zn-dependent hydrolase n=1 Tax=Sulfobacillus thermosulfidooxidans TaxID=28034 RepID=UPI0003FECD0B|nr:Zn-dependent hydrolase [Sulfobacillus thermosulfidooxidans]